MHYTDDELLDRLYEVGPQDRHLEACPRCRARWETLLDRRREVLDTPPETEAWASRTRVSLVEPTGAPARLAPVMALVALVLLALALNRPAAPPAQVVAASDAQLLSEVYLTIQNDEPRAAAAVHALFETRQ